MTLHDFGWFAAGLSLGIAGGMALLGAEQRARAEQVRALVAAYEARIAEVMGRLKG